MWICRELRNRLHFPVFITTRKSSWSSVRFESFVCVEILVARNMSDRRGLISKSVRKEKGKTPQNNTRVQKKKKKKRHNNNRPAVNNSRGFPPLDLKSHRVHPLVPWGKLQYAGTQDLWGTPVGAVSPRKQLPGTHGSLFCKMLFQVGFVCLVKCWYV